MTLSITFHKRKELLVVEAPSRRSHLPPEVITIDAISGGWFYQGTQTEAKSLPAGKWLITDDPRLSRRPDYFGLFYRDGKINDQFSHGGIWRNGIRFGFHLQEGSHGCIMTMPERGAGIGAIEDAKAKWRHIQELVRATPMKLITYQNNEDPHRSDPTKYTLRAYCTLIVKEF